MIPLTEMRYVPSARMVRDYGTIEAATLHAQDLATVFDHGGIYTMAAFDGGQGPRRHQVGRP